MQIEVPSRHTPEMIEHELDSMMGKSRLKLCLGHVMELALSQSPYVYGGEVDEEDVVVAYTILGRDDLDYTLFHHLLVEELEAAFRALEIIVDDDAKPKDESKKSIIKIFSPEWMCDIIRAACHAVPSTTIEDVMWGMPLVLVLHLGVSEARAQGSITRRPVDYKEALRRFKEFRKEQNNG